MSDTNLSEEDVSSSEAGRHGGVVPLQGGVDGPVDELSVFGVVVLQHHGRLQLLSVFTQQQACRHGRRTHCHLAEPVQQTRLTEEHRNNHLTGDSTLLLFSKPTEVMHYVSYTCVLVGFLKQYD